MDWFRLYGEFATDAKVQSMSEAMQRRLIMVMCLRCSDVLATLQDDELAFALRLDDAELAETKALFVRKGFIDDDWNLTNWDKRQYVSDSSTARSRKHRENKKEAAQQACNVAATPPDTETDTETETEQKTSPPSPHKRGNGFDAAAIALPDWLPETDWRDWVQDRKDRKKPITEQGAKKQIAKLDDYRRQGHSPHAVIANSIEAGYQGLFPASHRIAGNANGATAKFDPLAHINRNRTRPSQGGYDDGTIDAK